MSGNRYVGGLVGVDSRGRGVFTASYWDTETSGQSTSAGGEGKTTSELQSPTSNTGIYATWDDDVWDFGTASDYPNLKGVGPDPSADLTDYDADDDGLIEVGSLAQLDAIRYDLDGDGSPTDSTAYDAAFPNAATGMGCPSAGCTGYELTANLDFDTNGSGGPDDGDAYWNDGQGWEPIGDTAGDHSSVFAATFDGGGHTISNLYINRSVSGIFDGGGLFGNVGRVGIIRRVGVVAVDVNSNNANCLGGLVGCNSGTITSSYATGEVIGEHRLVGGLVGSNYTGTITGSYAVVSVSGKKSVGGLVGGNDSGTIDNSYSTGDVIGTDTVFSPSVGGLVGSNGTSFVDPDYSPGVITNSYSTGNVTATRARDLDSVGGFVGTVGTNGSVVTASYWDTETSGQSSSAGGEGKTTSELQSPTSNTGIYATWADDVWDFGTSSDYPNLKGVGPTSAPASLGAPTIGAVTPGTGTLAVSWTAPSSDGGSAITAYDLRHIETSADETDDSNWTVVDDVWATGGGTLQYTLTGLTGGTQYDLQVRAVNTGGDGPWSATATGTPATLTDREILIALYNATDGDNWTHSTNWLSDEPLGDWHGVTTDTEGRVTDLEIRGNGLTGTIPVELANLSNLTSLYLSSNQLTGPIRTALENLPNLVNLDLSSNQLTGEIPTELGNLSNLKLLWLSSNQLTGEIPAELGNLSNLTNLLLYRNRLTGEIPAELRNLSKLTNLFLSGNRLTGCIPGGLQDVASNDLDRLGLSPCLPPSASTMGAVAPGTGTLFMSWTPPWNDGRSKITAYDLRYIKTSADETDDSNWTVVNDVWTTGGGTLQHTLTGLTGATQYDLQVRAVNAGGDGPWSETGTGTPTTSSACVTEGAVADATNKGLASDCETLLAWRDTLAGTATLNWSADTPIVDWDGIGDDSLEGSPTRVTRLYLDGMRLDGMIPSGLFSLSELKTLYLHDNELTGTVPSSLGDLSNLTYLHAHDNDLTGDIPAELGELTSLQSLSLGSNDLNGSIPAELGKLTSLTSLSLRDNDLTGEIPVELGELSSLESLYVAENNLSGSIPAELGKLTNLVGLNLSDNDLEGEIPEEIGELAKLQEFYLHQNELSGEIPDELGQLSELTDLRLSSNYLSGQIPRSLDGLTKLTILRLAGNGFTGCLPAGLAAVSDSDADQLGLETCYVPDQDVIDDVWSYARETESGFDHVLRWMRVLKTLGAVEDITAAEAQGYADEHLAERWDPVVEELRKLEDAQGDYEPDQEVVDDVWSYARETDSGFDHVLRWMRVLKTFSVVEDMTAAEAQGYADRGWERWDPVVEELRKLEASTS